MKKRVSATMAAKSLSVLRNALRYELGLTYHQLAAESKLCVLTVVRFAEGETCAPRDSTVTQLQTVVDRHRKLRTTQETTVAPRPKQPRLYQRRRDREPPKAWERTKNRPRDERRTSRIQL